MRQPAQYSASRRATPAPVPGVAAVAAPVAVERPRGRWRAALAMEPSDKQRKDIAAKLDFGLDAAPAMLAAARPGPAA